VNDEDDLVEYARWWCTPDDEFPRLHDHAVMREVLARLDRAEATIDRVRALLKDEDRHRIRMDGNWVKWSDIADALDGPS
jgi:hypothetical protein